MKALIKKFTRLVSGMSTFDKYAMPPIIAVAMTISWLYPWGATLVFVIIGLFVYGGLFTLAVVYIADRQKRHRR